MMFFLGQPVAEPNSNAIQERRTMAPGEPTIAIGPSPRPGYGLAATSFAIALTVWYAGPCPGILAVVLSILPEQQSDQIFNAFFTAKRQGIGIGNRSIVELHGGLLWAQKTRGAVQSFCSTCRSPAMPLYDEQNK
jgi:hypothetical protein